MELEMNASVPSSVILARSRPVTDDTEQNLPISEMLPWAVQAPLSFELYAAPWPRCRGPQQRQRSLNSCMAALEMVSTVNKPPVYGCHRIFRDEHCTAPY